MRLVAWPALPLEAWQDTCATLHMWTQIVGKTRLALAPMENHWWHVALYVTPRGLTTSPMPSRHPHLRGRFRLPRPPALPPQPATAPRAALPLAPRTGGRLLRRVPGGAAVAGHRGPACGRSRRGRGRHPVRGGPAARLLRPRGREPLLAAAGPGRPGAEAIPRPLPRQGEPGPLLLGQLRPGGDAVLRPPRAAAPRGRAQLPGLRDGGGATPTSAAAAASGPAAARWRSRPSTPTPTPSRPDSRRHRCARTGRATTPDLRRVHPALRGGAHRRRSRRGAARLLQTTYEAAADSAAGTARRWSRHDTVTFFAIP